MGDLELALLRLMVERAGRVVTREDIEVGVYGGGSGASRRGDTLMVRLRRQVEVDPAHPAHLVTVFGEGYRLVPLVVTPARVERGAELRLGDVVVDPLRCRVEGPRGDTALTANEVRLLEVLADLDGAPMESAELARVVLGAKVGRGLQNLVYRLRSKIEPDPRHPTLLVHAGDGYRLARTSGPPAAVRLVGRDALLAEARALLAGRGALALSGPAGCGKSALARVLLGDGPGAWLDRCPDVRTFAAKVARALGAYRVDDPVEQLGAMVAARGRWTLVLDDQEATDGLVDVVSRWRELAPELAVVTTSRIRRPLPRGHHLAVGPLEPADAVALLAERLAAAGLRVEPDDPRMPQWAEELDRLPMALELGALRLAALRTLPDTSDTTADVMGQVLDLTWSGRTDAEHDAVSVLALVDAFTVADAELLLGDRPAARSVTALLDAHLLRDAGTDAGEAVLTVPTAWRRSVPPARPELRRRALEALAPLGAPEQVDAVERTRDPVFARRTARLAHALARLSREAPSLGVPDLAVPTAVAAALGLAGHAPGEAVEILGEALGDAGGHSAEKRLLGTLMRSSGRGVEALAWYEKGLEAATALGCWDDAVRCAVAAVGVVRESGGSDREAAHWVTVAEALVDRATDPFWGPWVRVERSLVENGSREERQVHLLEALEIARRQGHRTRQALALERLAAVVRASGARARAADLTRLAADAAGDGLHQLLVLVHRLVDLPSEEAEAEALVLADRAERAGVWHLAAQALDPAVVWAWNRGERELAYVRLDRAEADLGRAPGNNRQAALLAFRRASMLNDAERWQDLAAAAPRAAELADRSHLDVLVASSRVLGAVAEARLAVPGALDRAVAALDACSVQARATVHMRVEVARAAMASGESALARSLLLEAHARGTTSGILSDRHLREHLETAMADAGIGPEPAAPPG